MNDKEMLALDAWIAHNLMGLALCTRHPAILNPNEFVITIPSGIVRAKIGAEPTKNFVPTTDPANAMEVLKKCLDKGGYRISMNVHLSSEFQVFKSEESLVRAETLELAICLFAKKLFST